MPGKMAADQAPGMSRLRSAGVVLAGGRSSRMGTPKAALEWHGSTLLRRAAGILARATDGPVIVVRAPGQVLPDLPPQVQVADDPAEGLGPVQGLAAGLAAAAAAQAEAVFACATDMPFLHPAFVRRVLRAIADTSGGSPGPDVALPVARGHRQPLAAGYRTALAPAAAQLVADGRLRPAFLFGQCRVRQLDEAALRADPVLAALDPGLDSVVNLNEPADYQRARARPAPPITIQRLGSLADGHSGPQPARAATVAAAAAAAGLPSCPHIVAAVNSDQMTSDGQVPLAAGDAVFFWPADADS